MEVPVVVAGAGPAGLALACELEWRGVKPLVVDRLPAGKNTSRAAVVHARTLEVLEPLGVTPRLLENGIIVREFRVRDRDKVLATICFDGLPTPYPFALMCPQDKTEHVLLEKLEASGGSVTRPCDLVSLSDTGQAVRVRYKCGGTEHEVSAQWLVGCDGGHSTVREQAGIPFEGGAYDESFILADVEMDWPFGPKEIDLFFSGDGLVVVAPLPAGRFRVVATVDHPRDAEPTVEDFQKILNERGPGNPPGRITKLHWASRFHISHRVAQSLRKGRVIVAGDAAHVHSPAGGQGMNTGIQDAVSLAEALAVAIDTDQDQALQVWEKDRLQVARDVVGFTDRLTRMATVSAPVLKGLRNVVIQFIGHIPYAERALAKDLAELTNK